MTPDDTAHFFAHIGATSSLTKLEIHGNGCPENTGFSCGDNKCRQLTGRRMCVVLVWCSTQSCLDLFVPLIVKMLLLVAPAYGWA